MSNTDKEAVEKRVEEVVKEARDIVDSYPQRVKNFRRYVKYVALFSAGLLWGSVDTASEVVTAQLVIPGYHSPATVVAFAVPYNR